MAKLIVREERATRWTVPLRLARGTERRPLWTQDIAPPLTAEKNNQRHEAANRDGLIAAEKVPSGYTHDGTSRAVREVRRR